MVEIVFYKGQDILSQVIKWWTKGNFSHCGFRLWKYIVIDIDGFNGIRARFDPWQNGDIVAIQIDRDPLDLLSRLYDNRKIQYSWREGLRRVIPWINDDISRSNCAEMVYDEVFPGGTDKCMFPDDVYNKMIEL